MTLFWFFFIFFFLFMHVELIILNNNIKQLCSTGFYGLCMRIYLIYGIRTSKGLLSVHSWPGYCTILIFLRCMEPHWFTDSTYHKSCWNCLLQKLLKLYVYTSPSILRAVGPPARSDPKSLQMMTSSSRCEGWVGEHLF